MLRNPEEGSDTLRGIIAAAISRYADRHLGMTDEGNEIRGRSIDFLQRWGFPAPWIELHANVWDAVVEDANHWITGLYYANP